MNILKDIFACIGVAVCIFVVLAFIGVWLEIRQHLKGERYIDRPWKSDNT